jgi:hypothetical protein
VKLRQNVFPAVLFAGCILNSILETFKEFPPHQALPGFNPSEMLERVLKTAASGVSFNSVGLGVRGQ